jgi:enoyl-CoA hydratase
MQLDQYKTLDLTRNDRILTITINNGPMNAVDDDLHHELAHVFVEAAEDPDSDLIILTGAGRAFCAGGDMDWFQDMIDDPTKFRGIVPDAKRIITTLLEVEKPVICRLNGAAAGLGASIALMCDLIIADEKALIGDPHVKVGLVAGDGGAVIWPQLIGYARAKEFLLTGDMMRASEAAAMGLINHAVSAEELDAKVADIAGRILANPRWAVRWTKTAINLPLREIANRVSDTALAYEIVSNTTADRQEAVTAFVEKRKPKFTGD